MIRLMARKHYTDEFRRRSVELYESTPGATLQGIARDLGSARGTLASWASALGTGTTTASTGSPPTLTSRAGPGRAEPQAVKVARLEARVRELEAEKVKLATERNPHGSATVVSRGHRLFILFPTDTGGGCIPSGPSTTLLIGRVVYTVTAARVFDVQSFSARTTNVGALLAP